jgi:hypothetical protein
MATDETRRQERTQKYREIVERAWSDPEFKQRLVANPAAVLWEQGIEVPASTEVRVIDFAEDVAPIERRGNVRYLVLPPRPTEGERSGEQPAQASGGADNLLEDWVTLLYGEAGGDTGELSDEELAQAAGGGDTWVEQGEIRDVSGGGTWVRMGDIIIRQN